MKHTFCNNDTWTIFYILDDYFSLTRNYRSAEAHRRSRAARSQRTCTDTFVTGTQTITGIHWHCNLRQGNTDLNSWTPRHHCKLAAHRHSSRSEIFSNVTFQGEKITFTAGPNILLLRRASTHSPTAGFHRPLYCWEIFLDIPDTWALTLSRLLYLFLSFWSVFCYNR